MGEQNEKVKMTSQRKIIPTYLSKEPKY
jgi:hypothetical protein